MVCLTVWEALCAEVRIWLLDLRLTARYGGGAPGWRGVSQGLGTELTDMSRKVCCFFCSRLPTVVKMVDQTS